MSATLPSSPPHPHPPLPPSPPLVALSAPPGAVVPDVSEDDLKRLAKEAYKKAYEVKRGKRWKEEQLDDTGDQKIFLEAAKALALEDDERRALLADRKLWLEFLKEFDARRAKLLREKENERSVLVEVRAATATTTDDSTTVSASGTSAAASTTPPPSFASLSEEEKIKVVTEQAVKCRPSELRKSPKTENGIDGKAAAAGLLTDYSETIGRDSGDIQKDTFFIGAAKGEFCDQATTPILLRKKLEEFSKEFSTRFPAISEDSGSSAILSHYSKEGVLSLANLGDSPAFAFVKGADGKVRAIRLTYDHKKDKDFFESQLVQSANNKFRRATGAAASELVTQTSRSLCGNGESGNTVDDGTLTNPFLYKSPASIYQYQLDDLGVKGGEEVFLMTSSGGIYENLTSSDYAKLLEKWFSDEQLQKDFEGNVASYIQSCAYGGSGPDYIFSTDKIEFCKSNIAVTFTDITHKPQQDLMIGLFEGYGENQVIAAAAAQDLSKKCLDIKQPYMLCARYAGIDVRRGGKVFYKFTQEQEEAEEYKKRSSPASEEEEKEIDEKLDEKGKFAEAAKKISSAVIDGKNEEEIREIFDEYDLENALGINPESAVGFCKTLLKSPIAAEDYQRIKDAAGIDDSWEGWFGKNHELDDEEDPERFFVQQLLLATFRNEKLLDSDQFKARLRSILEIEKRDFDPSVAPVSEGESKKSADRSGEGEAKEDSSRREDVRKIVNDTTDSISIYARLRYKELQEEHREIASLEYERFVELLEIVMRARGAKQEKEEETKGEVFERGSKEAGDGSEDGLKRSFNAFLSAKGKDFELALLAAKTLKERGSLGDFAEKGSEKKGKLLADSISQLEGQQAEIIQTAFRRMAAKKLGDSLRNYKDLVKDGPYVPRTTDDKKEEEWKKAEKKDDLLGKLSSLEQDEFGFTAFAIDGKGEEDAWCELDKMLKEANKAKVEDEVLVSFGTIRDSVTEGGGKKNYDVRIVATKYGASAEITDEEDGVLKEKRAEAKEIYEQHLLYSRRIGNLKIIADVLRANLALGLDAKTSEEVKEKIAELDKILAKCEIKDEDSIDEKVEKLSKLDETFTQEKPFEITAELISKLNEDGASSIGWLKANFSGEWERQKKEIEEGESKSSDSSKTAVEVTDEEIFKKLISSGKFQLSGDRILAATKDATNKKSSKEERREAREFAAQAVSRSATKEMEESLDENQFVAQIAQADRELIIDLAKKSGVPVKKDSDKDGIHQLLSYPWQESSSKKSNGNKLLIHRPRGTDDVALVTFKEPKDRETKKGDINVSWVYSGEGNYYFKVMRVDDPNKPITFAKDGKIVSERLAKGSIVISEALYERDHDQVDAQGNKKLVFGNPIVPQKFEEHFAKKGLGDQSKTEAKNLKRVFDNFKIRAVNVDRDDNRHVAVMCQGKASKSIDIGSQLLPKRSFAVEGMGDEIKTSFNENGEAYAQLMSLRVDPIEADGGDDPKEVKILLQATKKSFDSGDQVVSVDRENLFLEFVQQDESGKKSSRMFCLTSFVDDRGVEHSRTVSQGLVDFFKSQNVDLDDAKAKELEGEILTNAEKARVVIPQQDDKYAVVAPPSPSCRAYEASELTFSKTKSASVDSDRGGRGGGRSRARAPKGTVPKLPAAAASA